MTTEKDFKSSFTAICISLFIVNCLRNNVNRLILTLSKAALCKQMFTVVTCLRNANILILILKKSSFALIYNAKKLASCRYTTHNKRKVRFFTSLG